MLTILRPTSLLLALLLPTAALAAPARERAIEQIPS